LTPQSARFYNDPEMTAETTAPPPAEFAWTVHLAARRPVPAALALLACAAAAGSAYAAFGSVFFAATVALALFGSLADFFLPVRYRLTLRGAEARHLWTFASIEWKQVKRRAMSNEGIKLSPLRRPSRREPFRGVLLRFGDQDPDLVLAAVKRLHGREDLAAGGAS
jgi:hypothetical protein